MKYTGLSSSILVEIHQNPALKATRPPVQAWVQALGFDPLPSKTHQKGLPVHR